MKYFDLHCDTITDCYTDNKALYDSDLHISLVRGKKYSPWFQCFAVWIPDEIRGKSAVNYFDAVTKKLKSEIEVNSDKVILCKSSKDFEKAQKQNKIGAILTVEGSAALGGDIANLKYMADCGVRMITLTWNSSCEIGDGVCVKSPKGLTSFGKNAVAEMEKLGIVIDVSHASDILFNDVVNYTTKPFIASHSNSRTICNHNRNITDEQFNIINKRGGLVGITFAPEFLNTNSDKANIDDIIKHIEYFLSLGGEKCIALGSDFDGANLPNGIKGIESVEDIAEHMLRRNYSETLVKSILFDNAFNFFVSL